MVAIVTGAGLGLERSSRWVLGSRGQLGDATLGRYGENVYVNAATGNLIINRTDEVLIGQGPDNNVSRTYNSLGNFTDDNADNWQLNAARRITGLTGAINSTGSAIKRIDRDGSDTVYSWDGTAYVCKAGPGAYDRLTYDGTSKWTWTDGNSRVVETYNVTQNPNDANDLYFARLTESKDTDGNKLTYDYAGVLLTRITATDASGTAEHTDFTYWSGTNNLYQITTTLQDSSTSTRVSYTYDSLDRLSTVTTDLTPANSSDNLIVVTTYGYDASDRVVSISQTGGAELDITYDTVSGRVTNLSQSLAGSVTRETAFTYDTANRITSITNDRDQSTQLTYDVNGQLTKILLPPAQSGATAQAIYYTYNGNGDVLTAKDGNANVINYEYDANGNMTLQHDAYGNTITRTYDATTNALLTETHYLVRDPDSYSASGVATQPVTTRYAYDSENHLRFVVSAKGEVTEYQYYASGSVYGDGNRSASITYRDNIYDVSGLATTDTISELALSTWAGAIADRSTVARTDMTYDFRGNLSTVTSYSQAVDTTGLGLTTQPYSRVTYVYDQFGNLLSRQTTGMSGTVAFNTETFVYDGLGRLISSVDLNNATTTIGYNDGLNTTTVTLSGTNIETSTEISTYDYAGELISYAESVFDSTAGNNTTVATTYKYDSLGNLRMVTDATGRNTYYLYDAVGRKVADITGHTTVSGDGTLITDGSVTEYSYDAGDRLIRTLGYATKLTAAQFADLADASSDPFDTTSLSDIRPPTSTDTTNPDTWEWRLYDKANRLIEVMDGKGDTTIFTYDGMSNLVATAAYAKVIPAGSINNYKVTPPSNTLKYPTLSPTADNISRNFYDDDGRLMGTLDGAGYLNQIIYNAAGQKIETIAFAGATDPNQRATGTFADLLGSITPGSSDVHNRYFYDGRGLLRYALSAALCPTEYVYDAAGHVLDTTKYAGSINATTTYSLSYVQNQITTYLSSNAANETSWSVYDTAGRLAYTIDAKSQVTRYDYDAAGRLTKQLLYYSARTTTSDPTLATMNTWDSTRNASTSNRVSRNVYDVAGRLTYTVNAEGFVTEYRYDSSGRVNQEIRYADVYAVDDTVSRTSLASLIGSSIPSTAIQTGYSYDAAGRLSDGFDGLGICTHLDYDALGRVTDRTVAYGTADARKTHYVYGSAGRVVSLTQGYGATEASTTAYTYDGIGRLTDVTVGSGTSDAATTHYIYDNTGRVTSETDAYGAAEASITSYTYDAFGNVLTKIDGNNNSTSYTYDSLGDMLTATSANGGVTTYTYDSFGNVLTTADPLNNTTYFFYDKLNRLTLQIDPQNYATAYTYTMGGGLATTTHYATPISGTITPGIAPTPTLDATEDATTTYVRDHLDRLTRVTDAMGFYELYTLDAFGDRLTVRNKLGAVTTNTFDKLGHLISEMLPETSTNADGTTQASTVTNTFQYDARGNRTQMVEAFGLTEQRTTNYAYDKLDRLFQTSGDAVQIVDTDLKTVTTTTPTTKIKYDRRGNIIETDDAAVARTLYYYDDLNRKIAEVNALGTLSNYTYDDNGNMISQRVYGVAITLPSTPGGTPPAPLPANAGIYRETLYTYDSINRLLTTKVANLTVGQYDSSYSTSQSDVTIKNYYGLSGGIIRQDVIRQNVTDQNDTSTSSVWYYYDKSGRRIAQVDQEDYLTSYTLDADGNVIKEERFATKLSSTPTTSDDPAALRASVVAGDTANNRITDFTYDKNGRRLTEKRENVDAWTVDAGNGGALVQNTADAIITYTYNGLGEVTTKTEAVSTATALDVTTYTYDTMGRQTNVKTSLFADYVGAQVQQSTNYYYNGLNNLSRTSQTSARVTSYVYGAGGRLASMTDASGFTHNYEYDANGHVVKDSYTRLKSDLTTSVTEAKAVQYDTLGRATFQSVATWNGTSWTSGDQTQIQYNAYGDVSARGLNGMWQETFEYDNGGRLWRSTADDGTVKLYLYDANGNQTLAITSDGNALASGYSWVTAGTSHELTIAEAITLLTNSGASSIGTYAAAGLVVTISAYDNRGQNIQTIEPLRQLSQTYDPSTNSFGSYITTDITTSRTYNAFGEVASETDANGNAAATPYSTTYLYNTEGKLTRTIHPLVAYTDETGAIHDQQSGTLALVNPTEYAYYDLSGRLVGVRDANGNLNTRTLLTGTGHDGDDALVLQEFHADGGILTRLYDKFGDKRKEIDEVGKTESYNYDTMHRLTSEVHETRIAGSIGNDTGADITLTDSYSYDGLGQRTRHWNSIYGSSAKDLIDYDAQGRVVSMVDQGGNTTTYSYAWSSSLATTGLGTFGGWTETTVNAAGRSATEKTDYFGRTVDKVDFGSHNYDYTFDFAGRLVHSTNDSNQGTYGMGENIVYGYYNTGLMASQTTGNTYSDRPGDWSSYYFTSFYQYDANGNRTAEGYSSFQDSRNWYWNGDEIVNTYESSYDYYQGAIVTWDAMNRMVSFDNSGTNGSTPIAIDWEYDLNGNIRHMLTTYRALDDQGNIVSTDSTEDYWYKYDAMNRFTTTKGVFTGTRGSGSISAGSTGQTITYNVAGNRATSTDSSSGTTAYTYTADGYLAQVTIGGTVRAKYVRDAMGRVTDYLEYNSSGTTVYEKQSTYNSKSQVTQDVVTSVRTDGTWVATTTYDYKLYSGGGYNGAYQGGVITHQSTALTKNGVTQPTSETINDFTWWDTALQSMTTYRPDITAPSVVNTSTFTYDENGHLETVHIVDGRERTVLFGTDASGLILVRDEMDYLTSGDPKEEHFYFNGMQVGDISNNGTSDIDYAASITEHTNVPATGPFRDGAATGTAYADFDQSYDPVNGLNYQNAMSRYTVQEGDTLETIALQVWGDASFWYLIADANGMDGSETLVAGMDLVIPNKVHNIHNSADTYRVYDPNEAIGDVAPTTPRPPAKHHGCGGFGAILLVIIAVVVTIVMPYLFPATFAAMGPILGGAVAAVAGSVVSQGVGLATGIQSKFDWKAVGLAALGGAVGAGLAPDGLFGAEGAFGSFGEIGGAVARGVTGSIVTQGIGVATGLQSRFDWAGVAAAGIGAGVASATSSALGLNAAGNTSFQNGVIRGVSGAAGAIANAATRSLIDGTDFGDNLIAALPDVIGQTIGNAIAGGISGNGNLSKTAMNGSGSSTGKDGSSAAANAILATNSDGSLTLPNGTTFHPAAVGQLPDGFVPIQKVQLADGSYGWTWNVNSVDFPNGQETLVQSGAGTATFATTSSDQFAMQVFIDDQAQTGWQVFYNVSQGQYIGAVPDITGSGLTTLADGQSSIIYAASMMGEGDTAQNEFGLHTADAVTGLFAGAQMARQEAGTFLYNGKTLPLSFRGGQKVRIAKLTQGIEAGAGEFVTKGLFTGSVLLNVADAYSHGFSIRADTKATVGIAVAGLALGFPAVGVPVALVYSAADATGILDDLVYDKISNVPLISVGEDK